MEIHQNNINGNNSVYIGAAVRNLDQNNKVQFLKIFPKGSKINVISLFGDNEGFNFANQIKNFLHQNGYDVSGVDQVILSVPINGIAVEPPFQGDETYKICIGSNK